MIEQSTATTEAKAQQPILHSIPRSTLPVQMPTVTELALCEQTIVNLRPGQLYRFVVRPGCDKCAELAERFAPGTFGYAAESWALSGASNSKASEKTSLRADYDRLCARVVRAIHAQESGEDMTDFLKHALDECATIPNARASNTQAEPR